MVLFAGRSPKPSQADKHIPGRLALRKLYLRGACEPASSNGIRQTGALKQISCGKTTSTTQTTDSYSLALSLPLPLFPLPLPLPLLSLSLYLSQESTLHNVGLSHVLRGQAIGSLPFVRDGSPSHEPAQRQEKVEVHTALQQNTVNA